MRKLLQVRKYWKALTRYTAFIDRSVYNTHIRFIDHSC